MRRGFTLVELMIVIAIVAVIAALAVPALMASQRSSNERSASSALKTVATAEADFKGNDRDGNRIRDFWTRDLSGLFTVCPIGYSDPLKLIEVTLCGADSAPQGTGASPANGTQVSVSYFTSSSPKSGYWFLAVPTDDAGNPYAQNTGGTAPFDQPWFNQTNYAFLAYPETRNIGRQIYFVNEENTILRRALVGNVRPPGATPPGAALIAAGAAGTSPLLSWPTPAQLRSDYSKLD